MINIIKNIQLLEAQISAFLEDATELLPPERVMDNPNFRKWFGNSVTVNSDGTPMVFYHGTKSIFNSFNSNTVGDNTKDYGWYGIGFYFTPDSNYANEYTDSDKGFTPNMGNPNILPVYLSIKNPFYDTKEYIDNYIKVNGLPKLPYAIDKNWLLSFLKNNSVSDYNAIQSYLKYGSDAYYSDYNDYEKFSSPIVDFINKFGLLDASGERPMLDRWVEETKKILKTDNPKFIMSPLKWDIDGILELTNKGQKNLTEIFTENIKKMGHDGVITKYEYLVFSPNQIKSIYNNGQFSTTSDNISEEKI